MSYIPSIVSNNSTRQIQANDIKTVEKELFVLKDYNTVVQHYHVKSKSEKHTTKTYEILAQDGISLKCGGSVLTVDGSGIHLKAPNVDTSSGNGGVTATAVEKVEIEKPVYNNDLATLIRTQK